MPPTPQRWSAALRERPPALELEPGLFTWNDPERIANSLLQSAHNSSVRKRSAYGSAMAMLCLYINRAGRTLPPQRRALLEQAKHALRRLAAADALSPGPPGEASRTGTP